MKSLNDPTGKEGPPLASVVLPVYNGERYLAEAIDSILAQTWRDFELLLLDDGSQDQTWPIIESYCAKDKRCRGISRENRGLVATLNEGIALSRGEFLLRMDADDIALPQRFEQQIRYLQENPECVALGCRFILIDPESLPIMEMGHCLSHEQIDEGNLSGEGSFMCHPGTALRAAVVKDIGGYREEFRHAEDVDFFLRLAEVGKLANLPDVLLAYRQHPQSIGYAKRAEQVRSTWLAVNAAYQRRKNGAPKSKILEADTENPPDLAEIHAKWAWWALSAGNVATARKHAWISLRSSPFKPATWKVLACALRGR